MAYFTKKMNWFQFTIHLKEWVNSQLIFQLNFFHLKYILRKILNQIHPNGFSLCNWAKSIFQELWKGNISIIAIRYVFWRTKTDIHSSVDFRLRCNFLALGIQEPRKSRRNTIPERDTFRFAGRYPQSRILTLRQTGYHQIIHEGTTTLRWFCECLSDPQGKKIAPWVLTTYVLPWLATYLSNFKIGENDKHLWEQRDRYTDICIFCGLWPSCPLKIFT